MSKFKKLEKIDKMIFPKEESPEKVKEKEQNGINDFIANLDEEVYENLSAFPFKIPMKLDYPDSIELDDFILLSVNNEFYLFPKMFKDRISDYVNLKEYFNDTHLPKFHYKKILTPLTNDQRNEFCTTRKDLFSLWLVMWVAVLMSAIICMLVSTLVAFISLGVIFLTGFLTMFFSYKVEQISIEVKYINNEEKFNDLLPKLKALNFPLGFFENINMSDVLIY